MRPEKKLARITHKFNYSAHTQEKNSLLDFSLIPRAPNPHTDVREGCPLSFILGDPDQRFVNFVYPYKKPTLGFIDFFLFF